MLQKSRELTKKVDVESDSEDEQYPDAGVSIDNTEIDDVVVSQNPWMARPTSGKPDSSYSRPQAVDEEGLEENEQSEYSRPEELVNEEVGDSDDDDDDDEDYDEEEAGGAVNQEHGENESNDNSGGEEEVNNSSKEKDQVVKTGKPKIEVHDLSSIDCDKTIDEIFDSKQNKVKTTNRKKRTRNKNKRLECKKDKDENINVTQSRNMGKVGEVNATSDNALDSKSDVTSKNSRERNADEESDENSDEVEQINNESLSRKRTLEDFEEMIANDDDEEVSPHKKQKTKTKKPKGKDGTGHDKKAKVKDAYVDPKKLFTIENKIKQIGSAPNVIGMNIFFTAM